MSSFSFDTKSELNKLKNIVEQIPENQKKLCENLIENAVFMAEQLHSLRKSISENGWSEEYVHGANQKGRKLTVEADAFLKLEKSYRLTIKQLSELVHDAHADGVNKQNDALLDMISKRPILVAD